MSDNAKPTRGYNPTARDLIPEGQKPKNIASVSPGDTVQSAFTTMILYDYSQLPIVCGDKVTGVVKWTALATVCSSGSAANATIREYAEKAQTIGVNEPWEKATEIVAKGDYAIVVCGDDRLAGIITASDMAVHLQSLVEPIANIQRIEDALRRINGTCVKSECRVPSLGDQIKKLKKKWESLAVCLDLETVVKSLEAAKTTRDTLAHFKPKRVSESERENLRRCAAMLEGIQKCQRAE